MNVFVNVDFYQVLVSESDQLLIQRIHTEFDVTEWDSETSIMRNPWPNYDYCIVRSQFIDWIAGLGASKGQGSVSFKSYAHTILNTQIFEEVRWTLRFFLIFT